MASEYQLLHMHCHSDLTNKTLSDFDAVDTGYHKRTFPQKNLINRERGEVTSTQ